MPQIDLQFHHAAGHNVPRSHHCQLFSNSTQGLTTPPSPEVLISSIRVVVSISAFMKNLCDFTPSLWCQSSRRGSASHLLSNQFKIVPAFFGSVSSWICCCSLDLTSSNKVQISIASSVLMVWTVPNTRSPLASSRTTHPSSNLLLDSPHFMLLLVQITFPNPCCLTVLHLNPSFLIDHLCTTVDSICYICLM